MACGCGGNSSSAPGPLLSGELHSDVVDSTSQLVAVPDVSTADAGGALSVGATNLSSSGFWILLALVIGGAWYLDSVKRGNE